MIFNIFYYFFFVELNRWHVLSEYYRMINWKRQVHHCILAFYGENAIKIKICQSVIKNGFDDGSVYELIIVCIIIKQIK